MASIVKSGKSNQTIRLDWYTIAKDVMKEWSVIVMISIAAVLFSYSWQYLHYSPTYSMTATFTVNSRVATTDVYSNLGTTSSTASTFAKVLDSSLMQKKIAADLGMSYMPGTASVNMIENTNLLEVKVVENTPKLTSDVYRSIMKHYYEISEPLLGDVILTTLIDSEIPTKADKAFDPITGMYRSFLIALIAVIIFLGVLSYLKDTVRREEDIEEKLDTKLLGTLAHERKFGKGFGKNKEQRKAILISDPMVSFRYAESMKKIGNKIAGKMKRRGVKTVLITSVMENEGKSTVAANVALALSKRSDKVLLIDGDFRKPAMFKIFDVDPTTIQNFGEVLNGNGDIQNLVCTKDNLNLRMILNSVRFPDSTDMIAQNLMTKVIHRLEQQYDYIVIDSSPMALVADTQEWMEIVDAAVLVVRQNSSSVRDINDAISMLNHDHVRLLGCIFNNVEGKKDKFVTNTEGRYGKYGKYGNYGKKKMDSSYSDYSQYSKKNMIPADDNSEDDDMDSKEMKYDAEASDPGEYMADSEDDMMEDIPEDEDSLEEETDFEEEESFEEEADFEDEETFEEEADFEDEETFEEEADSENEETFEEEADSEDEISFDKESVAEVEDNQTDYSKYSHKSLRESLGKTVSYNRRYKKGEE